MSKENSATIIDLDGNEKKLDHRPTLEEAQKIVGGWIQMVSIGQNKTVLCDEEGILKYYSINVRATMLFSPYNFYGTIIVLEGWRTVANG